MGFGDGYNSPKFSGQTAYNTETGERAKRILSPDMVAHVWAQGRQTIGETAKGNFYFEGPTLYSYGRHYVAGYLLPNGFALISADRFSPTTNGHVSMAWRATRPRHAHAPDLTELRRALENLTRGGREIIPPGKLPEDSPEWFVHQVAAARELVESYVYQRAADYPDACRELIPYFSATRSPDKYLERVKAKRARDVARETEAALKAATRHALAMGRRLLKFPVSDVPPHDGVSWIDAAQRLDSLMETRAAVYHGDYAPKEAAKHIAHHAKLMKAAGAKKEAAHAGKIARALYAAARALEASRARKQSRRYLYEALRQRRSHVAQINAATRAEDRVGPLYRLSECLGTIADSSPAIGERGAAELRRQARIAFEAHKEASALLKAEMEAKRAAAKSEWLAGNPLAHWRGETETGGVYLRAVGVERDAAGNITGGLLQTSHGAEVPLAHAIKAFRFVKRCRERGAAWKANGHTIRVGHFRIDRIEPSGDFVAGCHIIEWPQIEALARTLGVFDLAPDDSALESTGNAH